MTAASAVPVADVAMKAGDYIRLRREAEGLSIEDVAKICTSSPVGLPAAIAAIEEAEAGGAALTPADLQRLRLAFPFAPMVYSALAQGISAAQICRGCGCTQWDACQDPATGRGCAWTDETRSFCTACRDKAL